MNEKLIVVDILAIAFIAPINIIVWSIIYGKYTSNEVLSELDGALLGTTIGMSLFTLVVVVIIHDIYKRGL